jgi:sugar O-acyltransferase (sialic acid O-acetyltransferase NeuD family)
MRDIAILGAGGQAREVAFLIDEINRGGLRWRVIGLVERDESPATRSTGKYTVEYSEQQVLDLDCDLVVGVADPVALLSIRERFAEQLERRFPNLIHPSVVTDPESLRLGPGNVICAGSILTTQITLGTLNIINPHCTVGHDVTIGNGCVLNPSANVSGNVTIRDGCLVGAGAQILQGVTIGAGARVGAGAVVVADVAPGETVVGVPARPVVRGGPAEPGTKKAT